MFQFGENILEKTSVAEANLPYNNYYGNSPIKASPNSLFLFTKPFYTLEEVLRFSQKIDICAMDKINIAAAVLDFDNHHYPAIRIKNLPNYNQLIQLQKCFCEQGVKFKKDVHLGNEALIKINNVLFLKKWKMVSTWIIQKKTKDIL